MFGFLQKIPLFADLPDDDLGQLCAVSQEVTLAAGEELFAEGSPGHRAYVIKEGQIEIIKRSGQREILLAVQGPEVVIGELALLEDRPRMATARARKDSVLVVIDKAQLENLLSTSVSASNAMFRTILNRWRETESLLRQNEKMVHLGTLSAGVAHELNNPAAAVKRGSDQLKQAFAELNQQEGQMSQVEFSTAQQEAITTLMGRAQQQAERPPEMDAMARSDREYELESWLESRGVDDAWELAPMLVNLDYDEDKLNTLVGCFSAGQLSVVINRLNAVYTVYNLLMEISSGAGRISDIVGALKNYSYLDQAPVQTVDVHQGLDNTLLILQHKLKSGISVRRAYAPDLPHIQAYGSELNQVWTNLIDNAVDAMDGTGVIQIRTRAEGEWVVVEIEDEGPGIPEQIQSRIFEPFFTTKPPGKGTGLGLDISYKIIVHKHRGEIKLTSRPGKTCFEIWLPIDFETR